MYGITKRNQTLAILGKSDLDRKTDFFYNDTYTPSYFVCRGYNDNWLKGNIFSDYFGLKFINEH